MATKRRKARGNSGTEAEGEHLEVEPPRGLSREKAMERFDLVPRCLAMAWKSRAETLAAHVRTQQAAPRMVRMPIGVEVQEALVAALGFAPGQRPT